MSGWVIAAAFASGCYLNSLRGEMLHDDLVAVSGNPDVTGRNPLPDIFRNDFWGRPMRDPASHKSYRPLTILTFRCTWCVWGSDVVPYHVTNVALHACVVLLLMRLCREVLAWRRDASLVAAMLFAAHPVHTEAVSNIVGRADILCCLLYLASIIASTKSSLLWHLASLSCGALSLFAKEQGVTVFGVCLVHQLLKLTEHKSSSFETASEDGSAEVPQKRCHLFEMTSVLHTLAKVTSFLLVAMTVCYVRLRMLSGSLPQFGEQDNPAAFAPNWTTKFLTYLYLPAFNLWLLLCPNTLSYDWQGGSIPLVESLWDPRNIATALYWTVLVLLFVSVYYRKSRERRPVVLSLSILVLSYLPASNLFVTVGFVVAERVLYIPSVGFCLLVSHGLQRLMQRGGAVAWVCRLVALALILLFVCKTMARNSVWLTREALVRSGVESVPNNAKVHYNYANYQKDIGKKDLAVDHYRIAISLFPDYCVAHNNLGTLLPAEEGEKHFRQALAIQPYYAKPYYNLASLYAKRGASGASMAERLLLRSIQLEPGFVAAVAALASLYAEKRSEEAEKLYVWALTLDPQDADVINNYGYFLETHGRPLEAMAQYERAILVHPDHTVAIVNAARSLKDPRHSRRAEELYKRAMSIEEDPQVMHNLAVLYLSSGRLKEARNTFQTLIRKHPDRNDTKLHYVQLLLQERSYAEAEHILLAIETTHFRQESLLHLATLYSRTNRTAEALEAILRALSLCAPSEAACARMHEEHADILKDTGDFEAAEQSYKLALSLDSKLARTHQNLAVIYHIKGNYTMAEHHYHEAYKLDPSPRVLRDNMRKLERHLFCWTTPCDLQ